jgi:hypothetical protein
LTLYKNHRNERQLHEFLIWKRVQLLSYSKQYLFITPQCDNKGSLKPTKYKLQMDQKKWVIYSAFNVYIRARVRAEVVKKIFADCKNKLGYLLYTIVKTALVLVFLIHSYVIAQQNKSVSQHTRSHVSVSLFIYLFVCLCVCVCVCAHMHAHVHIIIHNSLWKN